MRKAISQKIKEAVNKEFSYKCAICGIEKPHLHHIDKNASNNNIDNLIPLCPNCHLMDQQDPTSSIPIFKLQLFRKFKDPHILSPKFHPLYERVKFLHEIDNSFKHKDLVEKSKELVVFVSFLELGGFYKTKIEQLIKFGEIVALSYDSDREDLGYKVRFREKLIKNRSKVFELVVELLRYQNWDKNRD